MAKVISPLLSLGATGSVGKKLTYQVNPSGQIVRKTPSLPRRQTLLQQYQRWLYEDYVQYWHEQTPAVKQVWEINARPHHMTGFAYWLSYHLTNLPDIVALWRMDETAGPTVADFSRNGFDLTNNGCTFQQLSYGKGSYQGDGVSHYMTVAHDPLLGFTSGNFSIELWLTFLSTQNGGICDKDYYSGGWMVWREGANSRVYFLINNIPVFSSPVIDNTLYHIVCQLTETQTELWIQGERISTGAAVQPSGNSTAVRVFSEVQNRPQNCRISFLRLRSRALSESDIKRHNLKERPYMTPGT